MRRDSLWERLAQADFLTPNEKRNALGYGPLEKTSTVPQSSFSEDGANQIRVGIKPEGRLIAREKTKIFDDTDKQIGEITSGTFGPSVNGPIAMGYVDKEFSKVDTKILLEVRGKKHPANVCALPFYKKNYVKGVN